MKLEDLKRLEAEATREEWRPVDGGIAAFVPGHVAGTMIVCDKMILSTYCNTRLACALRNHAKLMFAALDAAKSLLEYHCVEKVGELGWREALKRCRELESTLKALEEAP